MVMLDMAKDRKKNGEEHGLLIHHIPRWLKDQVKRKFLNMLKPEVFERFSEEELQECIDEACGPLTAIDMVIMLKNMDSLCEKCGECCRNCDPILFTDRDVQRLKKFMGKEVLAFFKRHGKGYTPIKTRPCIFFDEQTKRCTIYEIRPDVCRLFPLKTDSKFGLILQITPYCKVPINYLAYRATGILIGKMIKKENPALDKAIETQVKEICEELGISKSSSPIRQLSKAFELYNILSRGRKR